MDATAGELPGIGLGELVGREEHPHLGRLRRGDRDEEKREGGGERGPPHDHFGAGAGGLGAGASGLLRGCVGRGAGAVV